MDVFEEVKRIEGEAERIAADAKAAREAALAKARKEAELYRAQAKRTMEDESARLKAEHENKVAGGLGAAEADFRARRERLTEASRNVDALAGWVAERFLKDNG